MLIGNQMLMIEGLDQVFDVPWTEFDLMAIQEAAYCFQIKHKS